MLNSPKRASSWGMYPIREPGTPQPGVPGGWRKKNVYSILEKVFYLTNLGNLNIWIFLIWDSKFQSEFRGSDPPSLAFTFFGSEFYKLPQNSFPKPKMH